MDDIKISEIKSLKDNGVYVVRFRAGYKPIVVAEFLKNLTEKVKEHNITFIPEVEDNWEFRSTDAD